VKFSLPGSSTSSSRAGSLLIPRLKRAS
jgi:hypothetical protein